MSSYGREAEVEVMRPAAGMDDPVRTRAEALAAEAGAAFAGFWLEAPDEELRRRLVARKGDASDATPAVVERQFGYELGEIAWKRERVV